MNVWSLFSGVGGLALGCERAGGRVVLQCESDPWRMPVECERLQGFPDNWTAIDGEPVYAQTKGGQWRCKSGTPDGPRYAAMGDAVTVNVAEWIGRRIATAHDVLNAPSSPCR